MKKWYAVIGDPIAQSMSPAMHEAWFDENAIDATYIPIHVTADKLGQAVEGLKNLGCSGWNVTVPHKSAIIPFLDQLDPSAEQMNAVNTVQVLARRLACWFQYGRTMALSVHLKKPMGQSVKGKKFSYWSGRSCTGHRFCASNSGVRADYIYKPYVGKS